MFVITAALAVSWGAMAQAASPVKPDSPIGDWRGMSVCPVKPSGCNDEDSLYHFKTITGKADEFELQADKIADGKVITIVSGSCSYNGKTPLACTVSGSAATLRFEINGNEIYGQMTLADGTLWRKRALKKVRN